MIRLILFLVAILAAAAGLHWLADRPGTIVIEWQNRVIETSVFRGFVLLLLTIALLLFAWSLVRWLWSSPAMVSRLINRRREQRGLDALSSGMIAIGAGDRQLASRYALQARKSLPNEPLTHLLRAQAAQLTGDRATSRRIFEAMLASPDTEQLGLRGLFLEAQREGAQEPARQYAQRALSLNPKLGWPVEALFDLQCRAEDWQGALDTLAIARRQNQIDKGVGNRRRAVLLTAQAQAAEDTAPEKALELASEAHRLAPDLSPAAAIAGRILASRGNTPKAARVLLRAWRLSPHPDLAAAYAFARPGDSPRDRFNRMQHLSRLTPNNNEGPIAFALTAIEAREWDEARRALEPLLKDRLTQRVCTLMARIEGEQHGDAGRVREWLARAVNAPRDPAWTADGVVSDHWAPVSPVTGTLDAFRWRVPVEAVDQPDGVLAAKVEELVSLGATKAEPALEHVRVPAEASVPKGPPVVEVEPVAVTAPPVRPVPAPATIAPPTVAEALPSRVPEPAPAAVPASPVPRLAEPKPVIAAASVEALPNGKMAQPEATPAPAAPTTDSPIKSQPAMPSAKPVERTAAPRVTTRTEPRIFVPSRAPDDPGPEIAADDLDTGSFRPSGAKA